MWGTGKFTFTERKAGKVWNSGVTQKTRTSWAKEEKMAPDPNPLFGLNSVPLKGMFEVFPTDTYA